MTKEKLERSKKLVSQYKKTFSSPEGQAVLHDLMKGNFLLFTSPHVPGDDGSTFKNIGKQEVVKKILHILKIDPEEFLKHVNEQEDRHV